MPRPFSGHPSSPFSWSLHFPTLNLSSNLLKFCCMTMAFWRLFFSWSSNVQYVIVLCSLFHFFNPSFAKLLPLWGQKLALLLSSLFSTVPNYATTLKIWINQTVNHLIIGETDSPQWKGIANSHPVIRIEKHLLTICAFSPTEYCIPMIAWRCRLLNQSQQSLKGLHMIWDLNPSGILYKINGWWC